ncbi:MAG TPA: hypothetical protein VFT53_02630 [Candidatus Saccharimonadales bacterium]|nr:hypothetical protein [Candidatus Saccharimonadales bacterium]
MGRQKRQSGLSIVEVVIVVAAVVAIGTAGFFVYQHNKPNTSGTTGADQISGHSASTQPILPSVTISSDGCAITAHGWAGLIFVTGSDLPGHHGAQNNSILSASTATIESSGGVKGEIGYGELIGANDVVLVTATRRITADSCPGVGGPSATDEMYPLPAGA